MFYHNLASFCLCSRRLRFIRQQGGGAHRHKASNTRIKLRTPANLHTTIQNFQHPNKASNTHPLLHSSLLIDAEWTVNITIPTCKDLSPRGVGQYPPHRPLGGKNSPLEAFTRALTLPLHIPACVDTRRGELRVLFIMPSRASYAPACW